MRSLRARAKDIEVHRIGFAAFKRRDVFRKKDEDSRVRRRLARQKNFQCRESVLLRDLDVNSSGWIG